MKKIIRQGIYETNSSMSHSLIIMTKEDINRWENQHLYYYNTNEYDDWTFRDLPEAQRPVSGMLYSQEEVMEFLKLVGEEEYDPKVWEDEFGFDGYINEVDSNFQSYEWWFDRELGEHSTYHYTTNNGEELVIDAKYGMD